MVGVWYYQTDGLEVCRVPPTSSPQRPPPPPPPAHVPTPCLAASSRAELFRWFCGRGILKKVPSWSTVQNSFFQTGDDCIKLYWSNAPLLGLLKKALPCRAVLASLR